MSEALLDYYRAYTPKAYLAFLWYLSTRHRIRRLAVLNRLRDYQGLGARPDLLSLHLQLNEILARAAREWPGYDYGEGYFYQGLKAAGISGLRNTEARVRAMDLCRRVAARRVLEVGCNSGFLSLSIAGSTQALTGFDINPYLIDVANVTARFLGVGNARFMTASFEEFVKDEPYETILSFANHSTFDGNTRQSVAEYFDRCWALLVPEGTLLFESHAAAYEGAGLSGVIDIIGQRFAIQEQHVLHYGTFLDDRRTFVVATKK